LGRRKAEMSDPTLNEKRGPQQAEKKTWPKIQTKKVRMQVLLWSFGISLFISVVLIALDLYIDPQGSGEKTDLVVALGLIVGTAGGGYGLVLGIALRLQSRSEAFWLFLLFGCSVLTLLIAWWLLDSYIDPQNSTQKKDLIQSLVLITAGAAVGGAGSYFKWRRKQFTVEDQHRPQQNIQERLNNIQEQLTNTQEELRLVRENLRPPADWNVKTDEQPEEN
jgi:hypothetical protein